MYNPVTAFGNTGIASSLAIGELVAFTGFTLDMDFHAGGFKPGFMMKFVVITGGAYLEFPY